MMFGMLLFQAGEAVQVGAGALLSVNTLLLLRLVFGAGKVVQQIDGLETRVDHLEKAKCPHSECPLKIRFDGALKQE
jgi:hypothetical protein